MTNIINDVGDVISISESVLGELTKLLGMLNVNDLDEFFNTVMEGPNAASSYLNKLLKDGLRIFDTDAGRLILQPLVEGSMGVDYGELQRDSAGAVNTLEGAIGFSLVLDGVVAGIDAIIKPLFGDRAPEFILDSIKNIPQSLGMGYFLGLTLSNTFEVAVGTPLQEAINIQKSPSRLDIQTIRQALRMHKMTDAQATAYRAKLGYPEADWATFLELGTSVLALTDLQVAYEHGLMSDGEIKTYLESQGFSDFDINLMMEVYLNNSETAGGNIYRTVARTAYLENAISSEQFSGILTIAKVPKNSITLELAALDLQKSIGLKQLSAGDLKVALEVGDLSLSEVESKLKDLGYSSSDIELIIKEWQGGGSVMKPTVSAKTVIRYYNSKVISRDQAVQLLSVMGISSTDIESMLNGGGIIGSGYAHIYSPATVISAYKDGVVDVDSARTLLEKIGVEPETVTLMLTIAFYQMTHKTKKASGVKSITAGDLNEAYKLGLGSDAWLIREYVNIGYSQDNATLLSAIEVTKVTGNPPIGWEVLT